MQCFSIFFFPGSSEIGKTVTMTSLRSSELAAYRRTLMKLPKGNQMEFISRGGEEGNRVHRKLKQIQSQLGWAFAFASENNIQTPTLDLDAMDIQSRPKFPASQCSTMVSNDFLLNFWKNSSSIAQKHAHREVRSLYTYHYPAMESEGDLRPLVKYALKDMIRHSVGFVNHLMTGARLNYSLQYVCNDSENVEDTVKRIGRGDFQLPDGNVSFVDVQLVNNSTGKVKSLIVIVSSLPTNGATGGIDLLTLKRDLYYQIQKDKWPRNTTPLKHILQPAVKLRRNCQNSIMRGINLLDTCIEYSTDKSCYIHGLYDGSKLTIFRTAGASQGVSACDLLNGYCYTGSAFSRKSRKQRIIEKLVHRQYKHIPGVDVTYDTSWHVESESKDKGTQEILSLLLNLVGENIDGRNHNEVELFAKFAGSSKEELKSRISNAARRLQYVQNYSFRMLYGRHIWQQAILLKLEHSFKRRLKRVDDRQISIKGKKQEWMGYYETIYRLEQRSKLESCNSELSHEVEYLKKYPCTKQGVEAFEYVINNHMRQLVDHGVIEYFLCPYQYRFVLIQFYIVYRVREEKQN